MTHKLETTEKKKKWSFPIRLEAVLPLLVMIGGIWFYFATMFDSHMRWALQKGLTYVNGAEVNIARFQTKFSDAKLSIGGIQMTDNEHPENNWLQIGEIRYALDWNGLLRAKFVVDDASIVGIGTNVPRKSPGRVTPKTPEPVGEKDNAILMAMDEYFKATASGTFLEDIAQMKSGEDVKNKLKDLQAQLASEKKIHELQAMYTSYQQGWGQKQAQLKSDPEFKNFETEINALKTRQIKTPQEVATTVKEVESLKKRIERKAAEVQAIGKEAQTQVQALDAGVNAIPGLIDEDIKMLQGQLKLPDIKVEDLSDVIFGKDVMNYVHKGLFYYQKGKSLYATVKAKTPKKEEKEQLPVRERRKGKNYQFPIVNRTFPLFYVKHSELSVLQDGQAVKEALHGKLTNLSSSPDLVAEPTVLKFSGDIPNKGINGVTGQATFDHRRDDFKESFELAIAQIPVNEHTLASSNEAKIILQKASMGLQMQGHITAQDMGIKNTINLKDTNFATEAKGKDLERILSGVMQGVSSTQLKMSLAGPWSSLKMDVSSDLGKSLQKAFKSQFDQEVAKLRNDVERYVQNRINAERDKLTAEVNKAQTQVAEFRKSYEDKLKVYEAEANKRIEEAQNQLKGRAEEEKKKAEAKAEEEKQKAKKKAEEELKKKIKGLKLP